MLNRLLLSFPVCLLSLATLAQPIPQDAAQLAAQQAQAQAQLAAQQAQAQAQLAAQQAQQQAALNMQNLQSNSPGGLGDLPLGVATPTISRDPASTPSAVVLRLDDHTRGAILFYTTDGWTPTLASTRYTGPITLRQTTTLRAIAVATGVPYTVRSRVAIETITLPPTATNATPATQAIAPGAPVALVFTAPASSQTLRIGDPVQVALAQDLTRDGAVVARRLTPVAATVTAVEKRAMQGLAGSISFAVHSVPLLDGTTLALSGEETLEGENHQTKADLLGIVPAGGAFVHGKNAIIPVGATLTAHITAMPNVNTAEMHQPHGTPANSSRP